MTRLKNSLVNRYQVFALDGQCMQPPRLLSVGRGDVDE